MLKNCNNDTSKSQTQQTNLGDNLQVCVVNDDWTPKDVAKYIVGNCVESSMDANKSFTIFSIKDLMEQVDNWNKWLPRVKPYYAVKCSNSAIVLETLARLGVNFDCASYQEIKQVLSLGIDPERIIYAHTTKPESSIRYAKDNNVNLLTFDSDIELFKIKNHHPDARLLLRIKSDAKSAVNILGNKFGCCAQSEGPTYLTIAKDLGLNVVGICFHVGSLCFETEAYINGMRMAKDLMEIGASLGHKMKIVDIGGGFRGGPDNDLEIISKKLNSAMDEYFPGEESVEIIAEPGRYFVSSAFTLACLVHSAKRSLKVIKGLTEKNCSAEDCTKNLIYEENEDNAHSTGDLKNELNNKDDSEIFENESLNVTNGNVEVGCSEIYDEIEKFTKETDEDQQNTIMYFLDNGIYGSFAGVLWKRLNILPEPLEPLSGHPIKCSLWGPTCDGKDMICSKVYLPPLPIPSWLLFPNFGAYTCTTSTNFNGFSKPNQYTFIHKSLKNNVSNLFHTAPKNEITWINIESNPSDEKEEKILIPTNMSFDDIKNQVSKKEEEKCYKRLFEILQIYEAIDQEPTANSNDETEDKGNVSPQKKDNLPPNVSTSNDTEDKDNISPQKKENLPPQVPTSNDTQDKENVSTQNLSSNDTRDKENVSPQKKENLPPQVLTPKNDTEDKENVSPQKKENFPLQVVTFNDTEDKENVSPYKKDNVSQKVSSTKDRIVNFFNISTLKSKRTSNKDNFKK